MYVENSKSDGRGMLADRHGFMGSQNGIRGPPGPTGPSGTIFIFWSISLLSLPLLTGLVKFLHKVRNAGVPTK